MKKLKTSFYAFGISLLIILSNQVWAKKNLNLEVGVPYEVQERRSADPYFSTSVEFDFPYGECFFNCPGSDRIKEGNVEALNGAKERLLNKYLSTQKALDVDQTNKLAADVERFVTDVRVEHKEDDGAKLIRYTVYGKINTNLIDQLGGYNPTDKDLGKARRIAKEKALDMYIQQQGRAKISAIEKNRSKIKSRIDDLIEIGIRNQEVDKQQKLIKFLVKASINDVLFDEIVFGEKREQAASGEDPGFAFLILPREQVSRGGNIEVNSLDKVDKRSGSTKESMTSESASVEDGSVTESEAITTSRREVSGGTIEKAEKGYKKGKVEWAVLDGNPIKASITAELDDGGFSPIALDDILIDCSDNEELEEAKIMKLMAQTQTGSVPRKIKRSITQAIRECDVKYFATGTMTVDSKRRLRNKNWAADVQVTIEVKDYSGRRPKGAGNINSRSSGLGKTEEAAVADALAKAGSDAGRAIVEKIYNKSR